MKVLVDTNVILDVMMNREEFYENSKAVLTCCMIMCDGFLAAHSLTNLFYVLKETAKLPIEKCRENIIKLCQVFEIVGIEKKNILTAVKDLEFNDLEDSLQNQCAVNSNIDFIITRNIDDFKGSKISVVTPTEFMEIVKSRRF